MKRPFLVRQGDVQPYHPANHTGTTNLRLIGPGSYATVAPQLREGRLRALVTTLPNRSP
ncbi:MAG TPA: hypothetical protein VE085_01925 [Burkholderiales bacterium]|nr:hypothetical protein [Burkholderiales bacterium]